MTSTLIANTQTKIISNAECSHQLVGLGRKEISQHLENFGIEKPKLKMRTKQIFHWIYNYGVRDWSEMTNIAKSNSGNDLEEKGFHSNAQKLLKNKLVMMEHENI